MTGRTRGALTPAEQEVLALTRQGLTPAEIAKRRKTSKAAVYTTQGKLRKKGQSLEPTATVPEKVPPSNGSDHSTDDSELLGAHEAVVQDAIVEVEHARGHAVKVLYHREQTLRQRDQDLGSLQKHITGVREAISVQLDDLSRRKAIIEGAVAKSVSDAGAKEVEA